MDKHTVQKNLQLPVHVLHVVEVSYESSLTKNMTLWKLYQTFKNSFFCNWIEWSPVVNSADGHAWLPPAMWKAHQEKETEPQQKQQGVAHQKMLLC